MTVAHAKYNFVSNAEMLVPTYTVIDSYSLSVAAVIICLQEHITFLLLGFFLYFFFLLPGVGGDGSSHFAASGVVHLWVAAQTSPSESVFP